MYPVMYMGPTSLELSISRVDLYGDWKYHELLLTIDENFSTALIQLTQVLNQLILNTSHPDYNACCWTLCNNSII